MKKKFFISILMALALIMSPCTQSIAAETSADSTTVVSADSEIQPRAVITLLELNGLDVYSGHTETYVVTPKKGSNLKFIGVVQGTQSGIIIKVTKNGGWWASKTLQVNAGTDAATYDLINNCNGEPYTITITFTGSFSPVRVYGSFVQSDYA